MRGLHDREHESRPCVVTDLCFNAGLSMVMDSHEQRMCSRWLERYMMSSIIFP